ncbi:MAG: formyltetrahydrofolate deformylase [Candidatus Omnitrophota bacterium]|nr:formyltetrahydrofolate deformylase [Candidatus Omnitrophota bacterium]MBU1929835.1 formyltetrahydrofolate deformylase [Candidatus Omnitrophota bacterium]MBU2035317.1 formyltetrahydrofolate deformylase [Candidatus Omnitrophota bacterium]MBU2257502.1 formyltetrahydrofolate deformylase [Candidatus Omnitrophota bacterium]
MDKKPFIFVLTFQCLDRQGIVARISDFILKHNGNIITADQYSTSPEAGDFFTRIEFYLPDSVCSRKALEEDFIPVAREFNANWRIHDKSIKLKMGIFTSRLDHCLADLLYLWKTGDLDVEIPFVASNYAANKELVEQYKIPFYFIPAVKENTRESELLALAKSRADFLVLARYMLVLSADFLSDYAKDIINIHHGFLPSFKGARPYKQAFSQGVKVIGATAHFVTGKLDEGPIIAQVVEGVTHRDDICSLIRKGKNLEKLALARAIGNYVDYRVFTHNNKTIIFE